MSQQLPPNLQSYEYSAPTFRDQASYAKATNGGHASAVHNGNVNITNHYYNSPSTSTTTTPQLEDSPSSLPEIPQADDRKDPDVPKELESLSQDVEKELKDAIMNFMSKGHTALAPPTSSPGT
ncbi:hypothetical protein NMY22_g5922 [Coprinellus aureogranulatus]|nr:hypothetical protein NMY22_g5922 [Coprinellus aureogranulatus]